MDVITIANAMIKEAWTFDHVGSFYKFFNIDPEDIAGCDEIEDLKEECVDRTSFQLITSNEDKSYGRYYLFVIDLDCEDVNDDALYLIVTGKPKNKEEIEKNTHEVIAVFERCFKPVDTSVIRLELALV